MSNTENQEDPVWNLGTPMPEHYTCYCGLYVHPSVRNLEAIHDPGCPYCLIFKDDRIAELEVVRDTLTERLAVVEAERDYYEALYDAGCNVWNPIFNDMSDKCDALRDSVVVLTIERDRLSREVQNAYNDGYSSGFDAAKEGE